ncbi:poly(ADP-ribose) glycohydrolase [Ranunculus cassubicifolius]
MENREDLKSILPFLPLILRSSSLFWPSPVVSALKSLSKGPNHSNVNSGEILFLAISDLRNSLRLSSHSLSPSSDEGYSIYFDELMSCVESRKWFEEIVPALAMLLLRLPCLLEDHYLYADELRRGEKSGFYGVNTGLRVLESQEAGIVFMSQELISALLACSLFCLFPTNKRGGKRLSPINFDSLFANLYPSYSQKQENKIMCLVHYFERICLCMPKGYVSFERKVLPRKDNSQSVSYPKSDSWSKSMHQLCSFEVCHSGLIEDQLCEALEVDFANKYIGGGALSRGCVQEEIRFMINPELIIGMLFLPCMSDNEAIEIVGAERFSNYTGYASTFRFSGDFLDEKPTDCLKRRKTRIVAIDALSSPKMRQYGVEYLLREINKAFCGFLHKTEDKIGVVTGNWGCGAFGGDPEIKAVIQWLAASQASRPFILYYTFKEEALWDLEQVSSWILSHEWTVGDLWNMLLEYSSQRISYETRAGFLTWLIPGFT